MFVPKEPRQVFIIVREHFFFMLARTHLAFGILAGLLVYKYFVVGDLVLFFLSVALGAFLPDLDHPNSKINNKLKITKIVPLFFKHRGFFHSIFAALLISWALWAWLGSVYGVGLFAGYLSHLASDALTVSGINFLHPISTFHLRGPVRTGTFFELAIFFFVLALDAWLFFRVF